MKFIRAVLRQQTAMPVLTLIFATGICLMLVIARIVLSGNFRYAFLIWNLFLAWLPLLFAVLACEKYRTGAGRNWRFLSLTGAWLMFFPNAPYIFTDLIHLTYEHRSHFWMDMVLILSCALTGLVLGFLSLFLMQSLVRRVFGRLVSWLFIALIAGLSGFGVYLGRFERFNSWDILVKPFALSRGIVGWAAEPFAHPAAIAFPVLFATFLFITYLMLYALTLMQFHKPAAGRTESLLDRTSTPAHDAQ